MHQRFGVLHPAFARVLGVWRAEKSAGDHGYTAADSPVTFVPPVVAFPIDGADVRVVDAFLFERDVWLLYELFRGSNIQFLLREYSIAIAGDRGRYVN